MDTSKGPREPVAERTEATVILIAHPGNRLLGARYRLRPGAVLEIGRASSAGISLPDVLSVSRSHARLRYGAKGVFIEDLGSTNGTLVGDVPVREPRSLLSGERFQVGAVHFKFLNERDVEQAYHSAVYELMIRDGLTGALNKTRFEEHAGSECARAKRYGRRLSLVLFDIDEFKAVNDRDGHLLGDQVLSRVAARVGAALRSEQAFGRVGGEEFAILCPETTESQAGIVAERLRLLIEGLEHPNGEGRVVRVTCSFGVAEIGDGSYPQLFGAADRALYGSKRAGRNRISIESSLPSA